MPNVSELIGALMKLPKLDKDVVEKLKIKWAKKYGVALPLSSELIAAASPGELKKLRKHLVTKPTRTISGVSVVAIMAKPDMCPGSCTYCPKGKEAPQSYVGYEPAALRAIRNKYNPYEQVKNRLKQLNNIGHLTDKNELIIMGGTFPAQDESYQRRFVKRAFDGFNKSPSRNLKEAHKKNERAKHRVVGLTLETRPDYIDAERFLGLGATRIEVGVQSIYDDILERVNRKSCVEETIAATKILKDAGLKVLYHMMPGLPGSTFKKDLQMFKKIFSDERFCPDMLKIYPTLVIKGTKLYRDWRKKKYRPIDEVYMEKLLLKIYKICPPWVRIMRVQRDIPAKFIEAGPKKSNLRELTIRKVVESKEIRFREIGHALRAGRYLEKAEILVRRYRTLGGAEYFISAEDQKQDILVGFLRLRLVNDKALVRELHVYGETVPVGKTQENQGFSGPQKSERFFREGTIQHTGWGKKLMAEAEHIAKQNKVREILVTSGVGARDYYRKLGYGKKGYYMTKVL